MRWSVFFYLSSKRNQKFKHLVQTKPKGENTISNVMKVSVAGTSFKAKIVSSEHITNVTGHGGTNFLNDHDEADEEELR